MEADGLLQDFHHYQAPTSPFPFALKVKRAKKTPSMIPMERLI